MKNPKYKPRLIDEVIKKNLNVMAAIEITGPKHCGKTWTGNEFSKSQYFVADPKNEYSNLRLAKLDPFFPLQGEKPILIDEWQEVPEIWDALKFTADKNSEKGSYILTGSTTIDRSKILHSGGGRIALISMRPMSLWEMNLSTGQISLEELKQFNKNSKVYFSLERKVNLENLIDITIKGGWPSILDEFDSQRISFYLSSYLKSLTNLEKWTLKNKKVDTNKLSILLKSLARNDCTFVKISKLEQDISWSDNYNEIIKSISGKTISKYIEILKKIFIIEEIPMFDINYVSQRRIQENGKLKFVDPSLSISLLNLNREKLMNNLAIYGLFFESLVLRDLQTYSETFNGKIFQYRDTYGQEIDAILEYSDGEYIGIEIKLGDKAAIDLAAKNLLKFKSRMIDEEQKLHQKLKNPNRISKTYVPSDLVIISGLETNCYRREDGVLVVPFFALKN